MITVLVCSFPTMPFAAALWHSFRMSKAGNFYVGKDGFIGFFGNLFALFYVARVLVVSSRVLVVSSRVLVVSGRVMVVSGRVMVVGGRVLVVSGRIADGKCQGGWPWVPSMEAGGCWIVGGTRAASPY